MKIIRVLPFLMLAGLAVPVAAQHQVVRERLEQWNAAAPQPEQELISKEIRAKVDELYGDDDRCDSSRLIITDVRPATSDRFIFTGVSRGTLRNGWFVTSQLPTCDDAQVRFLVTQKADRTLHTIRVNRGHSYAWESLISDTLPQAVIMAQTMIKKQDIRCANEMSFSLGQFRIASEERLGSDTYGIRYDGGWEEIWPIELCEKIVEVSVAFTADGDGGAYTNVSEEKTRILDKP